MSDGFTSVTIPYFGASSFVDPGNDSWTVTVNYGGGVPGVSGPVALTFDSSTHAFDFGSLFPQEGSFNVTIVVTDDDGGVGTTSFFVNVFLAQPLSATRLTADPGTLDAGEAGDLRHNCARDDLKWTRPPGGRRVFARCSTRQPGGILDDTGRNRRGRSADDWTI